MGTRSNIYIETEPGKYVGTYCHYDGYPDHMLPTLQAFDSDTLLAHVLLAAPRGGFRSLMSEGTEYLDDHAACILQDPLDEDYGPDYVYVKCHDGAVKWRDATSEAIFAWRTELP
tara:strand:- start:130 stop:474 length:345 start_codon:yes stop_codon:yes gene_type:complete